MTTYNTFDLKIQCEELNAVSEDEYNEVMQMMAEETEGYENLPTSDQQAWEVEQDTAKDWLGQRNRSPYTNIDNGNFYNGIAI